MAKRLKQPGGGGGEPRILHEGFSLVEAMCAGEDVHNCLFENERIDGARLPAVTFDECVFRGCAITRCKAPGLRFYRSVLEGCDLSNSDLSGAVLDGVRVAGCKAVGLNLSESRLTRVAFDELQDFIKAKPGGKEIEAMLARIAAKARAAGIIATTASLWS